MALLEGLDAVEWSRFQHAYGPATDVPMLLRALVDPDSAPPEFKRAAEQDQGSVLRQAQFELGGNVVHQGSVFEVTPQVTPFLVELVCADALSLELREYLLRYVSDLTRGDCQWPRRIDLESPRSPWTNACVASVERELPRLLPLLETPLALEVMGVLALLERVAPESAPALWKVVHDHHAEMLGAVALVALARLEQPGVSSAARVMSDAIAGNHVGAAFAAIADLLASSMGAASAVTTQTLINLSDDWLAQRCPFSNVLRDTVEPLLTWLPWSAREQLIKRDLERMLADRPHLRYFWLRKMTELVELDGQVPLNALQREVIRLIIKHYPWNHSHRDSFFKSARIPEQRDQLQLLAR
ncbi:MAG: hypothetical protein QM817_29060 [Archangium sp.]